MTLEKEGFEVLRAQRGRPSSDKPSVSVGKNYIYFSRLAAGKMDFKDDESVMFARRGEDYFAYRTEFGAKGSYRAKKGKGGQVQVQAKRAIESGIAVGKYLLSDPIHVSGLDLFKLTPDGEEAQ